MRNRTLAWLFAIFLAMTAVSAAQSPEEAQLARFREKIRRDMTTLPNYTCLETIERSRRAPPLDFMPAGTIRLEVSIVAGKELFAKPGARRFEDREVASLVPGGAIGTGMFATFARELFVKGKGSLRYHRAGDLVGHAGSVRYDFRLKQEESALKLEIGSISEIVAAKGSFWFDPVSLDLIRLEVYGDHLPADLNLDEAVTRTDYARTHIGDSDALLPKRSEMTMTSFYGPIYRDVIEFSQCREYRAESTVNFDR
ncbi:MAG: hypothetical protein WBL61_08830 [Bryobacteraceae bacterium]